MNKQEAIKRKELLEKEVLELEEFIRAIENKIWKPIYNGGYYFISGAGEVEHDCWNDNCADRGRLARNNIFRDKEDAEFESEKHLVESELERFALENNDMINWNDNNMKYYMEYYFDGDNVEFDCYTNYRVQGAIYFTSEEILEDAIKTVGEDKIKKYIFGIE